MGEVSGAEISCWQVLSDKPWKNDSVYHSPGIFVPWLDRPVRVWSERKSRSSHMAGVQ